MTTWSTTPRTPEGARVLAGLGSGDGPLSVRTRPSSLKRDCARRTNQRRRKGAGQCTRKVTLDPVATADTPVRNQGPGRSLPGPDAGHPLQRAGGHSAVPVFRYIRGISTVTGEMSDRVDTGRCRKFARSGSRTPEPCTSPRDGPTTALERSRLLPAAKDLGRIRSCAGQLAAESIRGR